MTLHLMVTGMSGQSKRCADMAIDSPQTSLNKLQANHAPLLEKGRQLILALPQAQQAQAAGIRQGIGDRLGKIFQASSAERQTGDCAEMSRWFEHRASASEAELANEEMKEDVEKLFPLRPDTCHALSQDLEKAAREFLASLQTVTPREPDVMRTLSRFQTHEITNQAAPKCEFLRQRALRRQIDFPDGFKEMNELARAMHEVTLLLSTEERARELATAYLTRIRAK